MNKREKLIELEKSFDVLLRSVRPEAVPVFGEGNPEADIVLIGEAPGARETELRRPFVGKAGENLNEFLQLAGIRRDAVYLTNTVKFRPVKVHPSTGTLSNRPPDRAEIAFCGSILQQELAIVSPRYVVTLGNTPLHAVTGDDRLRVGDAHGKMIEAACGSWMGQVYAFYHPASIIYNRSLGPVYREDVLHFAQILAENQMIGKHR